MQGERKRYTQMNADFQRRAREIKRASQMNNAEIEENNRMGKTRDPFKKI